MSDIKFYIHIIYITSNKILGPWFPLLKFLYVTPHGTTDGGLEGGRHNIDRILGGGIGGVLKGRGDR